MVRPSHGSDPLLRRPFSVFDHPSGNRIEGLSLLSKRIGVTTRLLFEAVYGNVISCLGPLGRPFETVSPPAEAWMVAGGWAGALRHVDRGAQGTRDHDHAVLRRAHRGRAYLDWFSSRGVRVVLSTEDGSLGERGRITGPSSRRRHADGEITITRAALSGCSKQSHTSREHKRPAQVSVERVMGMWHGWLLQLRDRSRRVGRRASLRPLVPGRPCVHRGGSRLGCKSAFGLWLLTYREPRARHERASGSDMDLSVEIGALRLSNPLIAARGYGARRRIRGRRGPVDAGGYRIEGSLPRSARGHPRSGSSRHPPAC